MDSDRPSLAPRCNVGTPRRRVLSALRQEYFACAGESVQRYGTSFDDLLVHLWRIRRLERAFSLSAVRYVDDLVHAVACTQGSASAWRDLSECYERPLIRHCRHWLPEPAATLFVRRMILEIRHPAVGRDPAPSRCLMAHYAGLRPLRRWLGNRIVGRLTDRRSVGSSGRAGVASASPQVADNLRRQLDKATEGFTLAR